MEMSSTASQEAAGTCNNHLTMVDTISWQHKHRRQQLKKLRHAACAAL